MFEIKTMNNIADSGLDVLKNYNFDVNPEADNPDALLIRSAKLHDMVFGDKLLAIARAGVGYDNVPVERCTEEGIAVFNTAGANAESVKELAVCALLLASRDIIGGVEWVKSMAGDADISKKTEKGKSAFVGPEVMGKTLGIIGLGAIGSRVASIAGRLGMKVVGYDPYLSVEAAWNLDSRVVRAKDMDELFRQSDYVMIQIHYTEQTHHILSAEQFKKMKDGVRIINLARGELVNDDDLIQYIDNGKIARYVTDFPNEKIVGVPNIIVTPHIGASTPESEEKCAIMAAQELVDYLVNGNIRNSVNLPNVELNREGVARLCVIHKNQPGMLNSFLDMISSHNINVEHMVNKARGEIAYTIIDLDRKLDDVILRGIMNNRYVIRMRAIN